MRPCCLRLWRPWSQTRRLQRHGGPTGDDVLDDERIRGMTNSGLQESAPLETSPRCRALCPWRRRPARSPRPAANVGDAALPPWRLRCPPGPASSAGGSAADTATPQRGRSASPRRGREAGAWRRVYKKLQNYKSHLDRWDNNPAYRQECEAKGWTKWCKADLRNPCTSPGPAAPADELPAKWAKVRRMTELWYTSARDADTQATERLKDYITSELSNGTPDGPEPAAAGA